MFEKQTELFDRQKEMLIRRRHGVSDQRKMNEVARKRLAEEKVSFEKRFKRETANLDAELYLIEDEDLEIERAKNGTRTMETVEETVESPDRKRRGTDP